MILKDLKDQEREINNEYQKFFIKKKKLKRNKQLPKFNDKLNKKRKADQFDRHELNEFIK